LCLELFLTDQIGVGDIDRREAKQYCEAEDDQGPTLPHDLSPHMLLLYEALPILSGKASK
jgi:hypothetical protein